MQPKLSGSHNVMEQYIVYRPLSQGRVTAKWILREYNTPRLLQFFIFRIAAHLNII